MEKLNYNQDHKEVFIRSKDMGMLLRHHREEGKQIPPSPKPEVKKETVEVKNDISRKNNSYKKSNK